MVFVLLLGMSNTLYRNNFKGIARIDKPLYPNWVLKVLYLDFSHKAYVANLRLFHSHNNPILITFVRYLGKLSVNHKLYLVLSLVDKGDPTEHEGTHENEDFTQIEREKRFKRIRNKYHLMRLLIYNRELCKYRKNVVEKKKKNKEIRETKLLTRRKTGEPLLLDFIS